MREIEVKAHLRDREEVKRKLEELGASFVEAVRQEDVVYARRTQSMDAFLGNEVFLRIRQTPTTVTFTLKYHPDRTRDVRDASMPIEHEVDVSSRSELEAMLTLLGFEPMLEITKTRTSAHLKNWEICLDEVEGLGSFIEVEQCADHDADVDTISQQLREFLVSLGISPADIGVRRYDIQLLEKRFGTNE